MTTNKKMKEGYYVSAFICINELQNLLDIKLRHDQTIALWKYEDNRVYLVRYWELERISGIKMHYKAFYNKRAFDDLLKNLLAEEKLNITDIVGVWGVRGFENDALYRLNFDKFAFHSIAHLLTAICFDNPNPIGSNILGMALDAGPDSLFEIDAYDKFYYSACVVRNGKIEFFPVESPARLWSYSAKKFGLREGTLMALASAMDTKCEIDQLMFDRWKKYHFYSEESRINSENVIESIYEYVKRYVEKRNVIFDKRFTDADNILSMVMKIVNTLSLEIMHRNIDRAILEYKICPQETIIALAGGFSLNCPTNSAIINKYKFKGYQIPPCASDTGIAMGIGLAIFYDLIMSEKVKVCINSAYYGQKCGSLDTVKERYKKKIISIKEASMEDFAVLLDKGEILIWINDCAEIGPRALGNRSLIADPRVNKSKDMLNEIKKRQWWRPVAPMIMDEYGSEYFYDYRPTYNMLLNFQVRQEKVDKVKAVIHHDGSARVQSVSPKSNKVLYDLLKAFYDITQIPILCNTSLNDVGEPIINKVGEAIEFAYNKGLKYVCVNGAYIIELECAHCIKNDLFKLRNMKYFECPSHIDREQTIKRWNPYGLDVEELTYYFDNPRLFEGRKINSQEDAIIIKEKTKEFLKKNRFGLKR